jgi:Putative prokaryotic signal transducing protein
MESENNTPNEPGLVTVFRLAGGGTEEMEVLTVRQLLESNGINTVLVGDSPMPNLSEEIRVAEEDAERAQQLIADALAAGPAGAAEAEAESER